MKNITRILGISALVLLGACSEKSAPSIAPGNGDMKYIESSNVLDSDKNPTILKRSDSISIVFRDSLSEQTVKVTSGGMIPVIVGQDGAEIIIRPGSGIWEESAYSISISGILPDGTPVSVSFSVQRELGLGVLKTNVYNLETGLGYLDVAADLDAILIEFDREIDKVDDPTFYVAGMEIATSVSIDGNVVSIDPEGDLIGYNKSCQITFRAVTSDSQYVNVNYTFKTNGSDLVPVATNAEIVNSSVGQLTTGFPLDGTLWVKFNDSLDTDLTKFSWAASPYSNIDLIAGGTVTSINAIAEIVGDTLKVTPNEILKNVDNNSIVGFRVTVVSVKNQKTTIDVIAHVEGQQVHIVSTNVQEDNGLYRPFKVIGDSLVVTFSEAIVTDSTARTRFRVNNFVNNYSVKWTKDRKTVTIKNLDTLWAATFGASNPYEFNSNATTAYGDVEFSLTTSDGEEVTVAPANPIQIHTEYGIAIVNANILHKHLNSQIVVSSNEDAMDTIAADGVIQIEFNRALDTAKINSALANTYFILYKDGEPTIQLPISLSFSTDLKTVIITPETDLEARNGGYFIRVIQVPAQGITYAGGIGSHSGMARGYAMRDGFTDLLTTNALKVYYKSVDISALKATLAINKSPSGDSIFSAFFQYGGNSDTDLSLKVTKPAWNKNHRDSVDAYQVRVQKVSRGGTEYGWFYLANEIATDNYDSSVFATSLSNPITKVLNFDLSSESFYAKLQTPDQDGSGSDFTNGNGLFNDSSRIEIQIRPVHDDDGDGMYISSGEVGVWSSTAILSDNTAPCDSVWVGTSDCADAAAGGVDVDVVGFSDDIDGTAGDTVDFVVELTFAEDMTISSSNAPSLNIFWETAPSTASMPKKDESESKWINGRTYRIVYRFVGDVDYTALGGYYALDVSGVKDASGISITSWGSIGTAKNGVAFSSAASSRRGSVNIYGLTQF